MASRNKAPQSENRIYVKWCNVSYGLYCMPAYTDMNTPSELISTDVPTSPFSCPASSSLTITYLFDTIVNWCITSLRLYSIRGESILLFYRLLAEICF